MKPTKKTEAAVIVPVLREKIVEARLVGTRATKEFEDELKACFASGYKVVSKSVSYGVVHLRLAKTEEWTFEEFLNDMREAIEASK